MSPGYRDAVAELAARLDATQEERATDVRIHGLMHERDLERAGEERRGGGLGENETQEGAGDLGEQSRPALLGNPVPESSPAPRRLLPVLPPLAHAPFPREGRPRDPAR